MKPSPFCLLALTLSFLFAYPLRAADSTNSITELQQQVQKLKIENEALKQENQVLRKLVFEKQSAIQSPTQTPPPAANSSGVVVSPPQQPAKSAVEQKSYWMTSSSGKRHNNRCRYYGTSKGRQCGPTEGTACKVCGG